MRRFRVLKWTTLKCFGMRFFARVERTSWMRIWWLTYWIVWEVSSERAAQLGRMARAPTGLTPDPRFHYVPPGGILRRTLGSADHSSL